ncbi:hypothetical protein M405DRAFT_824225 [Rhizopogon salebrosus TDB-379]|nr:hypothetical protein M405DRAFT_824225 [Rhizopogon salebrosus TDB-379]
MRLAPNWGHPFVGLLTCEQQSPFLDGATRYLCLQNLIIRRHNTTISQLIGLQK